MPGASASYRMALYLRTVRANPWIPEAHRRPHPKQVQFLNVDSLECLYGGAAGGGKSEALLTAALQFVEVPGYAAILFRRTYSDLSLPGALIDRSKEWLTGTDAKWQPSEHTWKFPSGASLSFGYLDSENDRYRYQSTEFQFIGFDELTQFNEIDYLYLFSRLRRLAGSQIPLRMRAGTNPGGRGHAWVKRRFLTTDAQAAGRVFIPASLDDNLSIDRADYVRSLENLDSQTKRQLLLGDWSDFSGHYFRPSSWPLWTDIGGAYSIPEGTTRKTYLCPDCIVLVTVDWATSDKKTADYTAIGVFALTPDGRLLILDVVNERLRLEDCVPALDRVCRKWRPDMVAVESTGFQGALALECRRFPAIGAVHPLSPGTTSKLKRALPAVVLGENARIILPAHDVSWRDDYITQLTAFDGSKDQHDDMVDITAYAAQLAQQLRGPSAPMSEGPCLLVGGKDPYS